MDVTEPGLVLLFAYSAIILILLLATPAAIVITVSMVRLLISHLHL